jgi:hypothetical protein
MNQHPDTQELELRHKRAHHVFTEMLTSVSPQCKEALVALYDLMRAELELHRASHS